MDVSEIQQHTLKYHSHDEFLLALNENKIQAANHYVILNESKDFSRDCKWIIRDRYLIFYSKKFLILFFKWVNFTEPIKDRVKNSLLQKGIFKRYLCIQIQILLRKVYKAISLFLKQKLR